MNILLESVIDERVDDNAIIRIIDENNLADVLTYQNQSPLLLCLQHKRFDAARILIERGSDLNIVDNYGFTALFYSIQDRSGNTTKMLVDAGADVGYRIYTRPSVFEYSILSACIAVATILYDNSENYDINATLDDGTPILFKFLENVYGYSEEDMIEIVRFLVEKGADVNFVDPESGCTALMRTDMYPNIAKLLIEHGADVGIQNKNGNTALHCSVLYDDAYNEMGDDNPFAQTSRILLNTNLFLRDVQNNKGDTPLHIAIKRGINIQIELLLEYDASPLIKNNDDISPIDLIQKGLLSRDSKFIILQKMRAMIANPKRGMMTKAIR